MIIHLCIQVVKTTDNCCDSIPTTKIILWLREMFYFTIVNNVTSKLTFLTNVSFLIQNLQFIIAINRLKKN